jgi:hypothetical protein
MQPENAITPVRSTPAITAIVNVNKGTVAMANITKPPSYSLGALSGDTMIDLIDLMFEHYHVSLEPLDGDIKQIAFVNQARDHENYDTLNPTQLMTLRSNIGKIYTLLKDLKC